MVWINLGEGLKRVYIVFSVLVVLGVMAGVGSSWPSAAAVQQEAVWNHMKYAETLPWNRAASQDAYTLGNTVLRDRSDHSLIAEYCFNGGMTSEQKEICKQWSVDTGNIHTRQALFGLKIIGAGLLAAATLAALWLLCAWIARGFLPKAARMP